ncbi:MAG: transglycosylase SLT domain-containing protein [Xanthomonadales bacterium]|nr:transglycosylase SLT domain-containing protein [Xanthomonadales bacterium]
MNRQPFLAGLLSSLFLAACATTTPTRQAATPTASPPASVIDTQAGAPAIAIDAPPGLAPEPQSKAEPAKTPLRGLDRLANNLHDPECRAGRVVNRWISRYQERPQRWDSLWRNKLPQLHWVQLQVAAAGLPAEFALIPMVESHFRPDARNGSNVGMWQLSRITATELGLRVDQGRDERLDPIPATESAVVLLSRLMDRFGDWRLAAMAYNAGEYRIARALKSMPDGAQPSAAAHQPPGLSNTTYEYVAKLEAISCLVADPTRWGLALPADDVNELVATTIPDVFRSLGRLSRITGINEKDAGKLNPASQRYRINASQRMLLLPEADSHRIRAWREGVASGAVAAIKPEDAITHVVSRGESLWIIARRHRLRTRDIQSWNRIPDGALLHPGQVLRLEP